MSEVVKLQTRAFRMLQDLATPLISFYAMSAFDNIADYVFIHEKSSIIQSSRKKYFYIIRNKLYIFCLEKGEWLYSRTAFSNTNGNNKYV